jgi:hypothetical protein
VRAARAARRSERTGESADDAPTEDPLEPSLSHPPLPSGESRDVAEASFLSEMETALHNGGDSGRIVAGLVQALLGKWTEMKASTAAAAAGSAPTAGHPTPAAARPATPVDTTTPSGASSTPKRMDFTLAPCSPSPGGSASSSSQGPTRLTATQYGVMSIDANKKSSKTAERILSKDRHAPHYGAASELIKHPRRLEFVSQRGMAASRGMCSSTS